MIRLTAALDGFWRVYLGDSARSRRAVASLDGIRGLAVLFVLASHTAAFEGYLMPFYGAGAIGVWLFFVLSAFLLTSYFLEQPARALQPVEWLNYAVRRLLRIYPLFAIVVTADFLLVRYFRAGIIGTSQDLIRHLALREGALHYWTIPIEMQFYALLPFAVLLLIPIMKTNVVAAIAVFATFLFAESYFYPSANTVIVYETSVLPYACVFASGCMAAAIHARYRHIEAPTWLQHAFDATGLVILVAVCISIPQNWNALIASVGEDDFYRYYMAYGIIWGAFLLLVLRGAGLLRSLFEVKFLRFVGKISFGIYLTHLVIIFVVNTLYEARTLRVVALVWVLTFALAMLLHLLVEKPAMRVTLLGGRFETRCRRWFAGLRERMLRRHAGVGLVVGPEPLRGHALRGGRDSFLATVLTAPFSRVVGERTWLLAASACLVLAYLLLWNRGLYFDDYLYSETGWFWAPQFPARMLNFSTAMVASALLPSYELLVRVLEALLAGLNALLLGLLVSRILESRLAGVVSGWLFIAPFSAWEAPLWASANGYLLAVLCGLLFLHCFWTVLARRDGAWGWMALGTPAFVGALLSIESVPPLAGLVPLLGLIAANRQGPRPAAFAILGRALAILAVAFGLSIGFYWLSYTRSGSPLVGRGGMVTDPAWILSRSQAMLAVTQSATIGSEWGAPLTREVFGLGLETLGQSWLGIAIGCIAIVSMALTSLRWRAPEREYRQSYRIGVILCTAGLAWFLMTMLFPAVLARSVGFAYRLLYLPWAGIAVTLGALAWLVARRVRHPAWERLVVAVCGLALLFESVSMLGYARVLVARSELDQKQAAALHRALPPESIPAGSYLVYLPGDELLFGETAPHSKNTVFGVLENGMGSSIVAKPYRGHDLHFVYTTHFEHPDIPAGGKELLAAGQSIPLDRMIPFFYKNGSVLIPERLTIKRPNGDRKDYKLPQVQALRKRGIPTVRNFVLNH